MAEVKKARLFLRRGSDTDRKLTTLCEGELGYSTDAFRVFVGDGSTAGGKTLGLSAFMTTGNVGSFHTTLTEASAAGLAHKGDLSLHNAWPYNNAAGVSVTVANSATVVMVLTGTAPGTASSWVAVNSGIPWGNLHVADDDISGDKIHGGTISGDISFTGTLTTMAVSTQGSLTVASCSGTGLRQVACTAAGQLTAIDVTEVVASGATGGVLAMVTFGQTGSSGTITPKYSFGVTSVTEKLYSYANTNGVGAIGTHVANSGTIASYTDPSIAVDSGTGVYEIVFSQAVDGHANRPVIIQASNWRGRDYEDRKVEDHTTTATIDYKWKNSTTLIVVFSSAFYNDSDRKSHGSLKNLYPNSGHTDSRTLFTVQVF
tara:strand:+ start:81 stop:1199 length:1119 start_codon:yes stop_codon:yes gene_type:complete